uniref:Orf40a n=1 Tax=Picea abies TaxID=3329 RepID=O62955_PICAB|nr:orf40a [Picea abies]
MLCIAVPKGILVEVDLIPINKNPFPNCTSLSQGIQLSGCI